ncbi:MAG: tetratricopeptide repeat protein [Candidatus Hodarchaeota archaeon]
MSFSDWSRQQAKSLILQAIELCKEGSLKEAKHKIEQAIELVPDHPAPRIILSEILYRNYGRYSQAETQLNIADNLNPNIKNQHHILYHRACIRFALKRYIEAIDLFKQAISVYKDAHDIQINLGLCYERLGEWKKALEHYKCSNEILNNLEAQIYIKLVEQRMWQSKEMKQLIESYEKSDEGFKIDFPKCENNHLTSEERENVKKVTNDSLVFFVGAGVSFPRPSCLPMASQILKNMFCFLFELDKQEICEIFKFNPDIKKEQAYKKLAHQLAGECFFPFEATFQGLYEILGYPVIRFVELLKMGKPNLHHVMLAYAMNKGHTVITTNFDQHIENAYKNNFGKSPKLLITDKDYQEAIDNNQIDGVLAKIHGDIDDYNSIALTFEGVTATTDRTIYIGDDIDAEKGIQQFQMIHQRTTLSIPKALFLQKVLQEKKIILIGYSGSDNFDIMPILKNSELICSGLWVVHSNEEVSKEIKEWKQKATGRLILQPKTEEEKKLDITSKVSRYFLLDIFNGNLTQEINEKCQAVLEKEKYVDQLSMSFNKWIGRLCLRPGDGLHFLGRLFSHRGKWEQAKLLLTKAMEKYKENIEHNEERWLATKSYLGYTLDNLEQFEQALKIFTEVKKHIEDSEEQKLYPTIYANILINIAGKWINTNKDNEAVNLLNKVMELVKGIDEIANIKILCQDLSVVANRHFGRKEWKEALEIYSIIIRWSIDLGDLREACISSMPAALCLAYLSKINEAK